MKTFNFKSKRLAACIGAISLLSLTLSSCLKTSNDNTYSPPVAFVTFIQASPDEPLMDFYLDNDRINLNPINYGDHFDYFRAYTGKRTAHFYSESAMSPILSDTLNLVANTNYSLFLANKATKPELVVLTDTIKQPATGNAGVRFINLSPDAPAVDLVVTGGSKIVSNKGYKGYSSFLPITGNSGYNLQIVQTGTSTVLATLTNVTLNAGSLYTIWFHGLATPTSSTDQLSASIYNNAYFN